MRSLARLPTRWGRGPAILLAILTLAASGCGSSDGDTATTAEATTTTAAAASESEDTAPESPGMEWPGPDEDLDVLFVAHIGDLGEAIPEMFAEHVSDELGNDVAVHYPSGMHTGVSLILGHMGGGRFPDISEMVTESEIIVLQTWPSFPAEGDDTAFGIDREKCKGGEDQAGEAPASTDADYWQPYRDSLDTIYAKIWELRGASPTMIIALDLHNSYLGGQRQAGIDEQCRTWLEAWSQATEEAAAENGALMVSVYDVLNGSNHDVDPAEMGYLGATHRFPTLRWHTPNEVGGEMVVDALSTVDLEPGSA